MKEFHSDQKKVLTLPETASLLRVSPLTVRRAIKNGKIRATQLNPRGRYRILLQDLEKFIS